MMEEVISRLGQRPANELMVGGSVVMLLSIVVLFAGIEVHSFVFGIVLAVPVFFVGVLLGEIGKEKA